LAYKRPGFICKGADTRWNPSEQGDPNYPIGHRLSTYSQVATMYTPKLDVLKQKDEYHKIHLAPIHLDHQ